MLERRLREWIQGLPTMNARNRRPSRPKLKSPLDKKLKGRRTSFVVMSFAVVVCVALVVGPWIWLTMSVVGKRELTQTGMQTTATITKHHSRIPYGAHGSGELFWINYTFTAGNQTKEYATDVMLPLDLWDTVEVGSTISVTYNPGNPSEQQPTMMLKRLSPPLTGGIGIHVGALSVGASIWLTHLLLRVIGSRRRKIKGPDPRTNMAGGGTSKNNSLKKHRSQREAPRNPIVEKTLVVLGVLAVFAAILVVLSMYLAVLVFGMEFLGPLVVETIQSNLL